MLTGDRELVYSLTLPQPGDMVWKPSNVKHRLAAARAPWPDLPRSLALAGAGRRGWACWSTGFFTAASIAACAPREALRSGTAWRKAS